LIVGIQKWELSCKVRRRPPVDIFLNESLPPLKTPLRTPCSWPPWLWFSCEKSLKIKFRKKNGTLTLTLKICILQGNGFKELTLSCLKAWFKGYTFRFTPSLVRPYTGPQRSHERAPKNVQMTLKDQSFVKKFKVSFLCLPEDV
jgi:hypothetical protein